MKHLFTFCLLAALLTLTMYSQPRFGLTAGVNFANFGGSDASSMDTRTGFAAGGYLDIKVAESMVLKPAILYSMKGCTGTQNYSGTNIDLTLKYDYLDIPVLLQYEIKTPESTVKPLLYAGPSIGFLLSSKVKAEANGSSAEVDIKEQNSVDFGLVFGGGLAFPIGQSELNITVRYGLGLASVDNSSPVSADLKNRYFAIMAGVTF